MVVLAALVLSQGFVPKNGAFLLGDGTRILLMGVTHAPIRNGAADFRRRPWWSAQGKPVARPDIDEDREEAEGTGSRVRAWWKVVAPPGSVGRAVIDGAIVEPEAPHPEATFAGSLKPVASETIATTTLSANTKMVDVVFRVARETLPWQTVGTIPVDATKASSYPRTGLFPPETFTFLLVESPELAVEWADAEGKVVSQPLGGKVDPKEFCGRWIADLKDGSHVNLDAWMEATITKDGKVLKRGLPLPVGERPKDEPGVLGGEGTTRIERPEDLKAIRFVTQPWQYVRFRNVKLPP